MAMLCTPEELDRDKCIRMALVHDLAETEVGDLTPHDTVENVEEKEAEAMRSFGSDELYELWDEYRRRETQEARFVKDLDELEMLFQATEYAREHDAEYDEFWDNADKHITTARGRELFRTIRTQS